MKKPIPSRVLVHSRSLRQEGTNAEKRLWFLLRNRRVGGFKFRRQHAIGEYIVDFFCFEKKLAVELDGGGHVEERQAEYDAKRTRYFENEGIQVLRFWNHEVLEHTEAVLETIKKVLETDREDQL